MRHCRSRRFSSLIPFPNYASAIRSFSAALLCRRSPNGRPLTLQLTVLAAGLRPKSVFRSVYCRGKAWQRGGSGGDGGLHGRRQPASFWIGLTLIEYLAVRRHVLPVAGYGPPDETALERLTYLIMPALALGIRTRRCHPLHPHQHVGCAAGGLRVNRTRQGPGAGDRDLQTCVPQCSHRSSLACCGGTTR
jgi:hypothetical protein